MFRKSCYFEKLYFVDNKYKEGEIEKRENYLHVGKGTKLKKPPTLLVREKCIVVNVFNSI